jgi:putative phosphoribosyl transferase
MKNTTNIENRHVQILSTGVRLEGMVSIPEDAIGIVLFVHGSGSSRRSPRNQYVAEMLQEAGLATLLFDLLTVEEEEIDQRTRHLRFDIDLLARRTAGVLEWLTLQPFAYGLKTGLFGASTGAAAALKAAAGDAGKSGCRRFTGRPARPGRGCARASPGAHPADRRRIR